MYILSHLGMHFSFRALCTSQVFQVVRLSIDLAAGTGKTVHGYRIIGGTYHSIAVRFLRLKLIVNSFLNLLRPSIRLL